MRSIPGGECFRDLREDSNSYREKGSFKGMFKSSLNAMAKGRATFGG
jgi:hypothetical protein